MCRPLNNDTDIAHRAELSIATVNGRLVVIQALFVKLPILPSCDEPPDERIRCGLEPNWSSKSALGVIRRLWKKGKASLDRKISTDVFDEEVGSALGDSSELRLAPLKYSTTMNSFAVSTGEAVVVLHE